MSYVVRHINRGGMLLQVQIFEYYSKHNGSHVPTTIRVVHVNEKLSYLFEAVGINYIGFLLSIMRYFETFFRLISKQSMLLPLSLHMCIERIRTVDHRLKRRHRADLLRAKLHHPRLSRHQPPHTRTHPCTLARLLQT